MKLTDEQVQRLVEELSLNCFGEPFKHKAYFNPRLRSTGGRYLLKSHNIELNRKLYDHFGFEELRGIILHELCHYHLHLKGLGYQHRDADFRALMKKVGAPRFCSSLKEATAVKKLVRIQQYHCLTCGQIYNRKRKMNVAKYCCSKCKGKIQFIRTIE